jgi:hypothetical protein
MSMTFADSQTELTNLLTDTLQQVSADRITQALTKAWNDGYVVLPVYDNSLTYTQSSWQYTLPATISTVDSIYIQRDTSDFPESISADFWEVVNGKLQFLDRTRMSMYDTYPLYIRGKYKLTVDDTIPDTSHGVVLQSYVVDLAGVNVLKQLSYTKAVAFLNNDTSMSELIALRGSLEQNLAGYRAQLGTAWVDN